MTKRLSDIQKFNPCTPYNERKVMINNSTIVDNLFHSELNLITKKLTDYYSNGSNFTIEDLFTMYQETTIAEKKEALTTRILESINKINCKGRIKYYQYHYAYQMNVKFRTSLEEKIKSLKEKKDKPIKNKIERA